MNRAIILIVSLALPFAAGFIGSLATTPAIPTWYASLNKPVFNPPSWLFGPVWTVLYVLMGIALYRVWCHKVLPQNKQLQRWAVILFIVHLAINALWSVLFFGLHSPLLGLIDIVALLVLIVVVMVQFARLDRVAAYLLVPYLAWVSFATLLNVSIWYLNR